MTVISVPFIYWRLPNDIPSARFLTEIEKPQAIERLRANQTGTGSMEFKWSHVIEAAIEPKTWLFVGMSLLLNLGAAVTNTFGPLILQGLGYDKYKTSLLNMPFGGVQWVIIMLSSWAVQRFRLKSAILMVLTLPVIAGLVMLYVLPRNSGDQAALLVAYYLLAFLFGGIPVIVAWIVANTAGTTKKSVLMSLYNAGASAGNIVGPLLFSKNDAPAYLPGLRGVLGVFIALFAVTIIQLVNLMFLNKLQQRKRVKNGKKAIIKDHSMESRYVAMDEGNDDIDPAAGPENLTRKRLGDNAFLDLTDRQNDEFTYVY